MNATAAAPNQNPANSISHACRKALPPWIAAASFEELERNQHCSSYCSGKATQRNLEMIRDMGFAGEEMKRRLLLIQRRFGMTSA